VTTTLPLPPPPTRQGRHLDVLIIDSFPEAADSLADLLRLHGHAVRVAYDAAGALTADAPDVVILELRLPGRGGWELVREMRSRPGKPPLFVAATTCASQEARRRSDEAGVDLHLVKPVEPAVLVGVLRRFARVLG
jgi:DNA-binding response OmpR family regulator